MEKLTHQEEEAMLIVWQLGECIVKDVRNRMAAPQPPYTTVASVVKNLEKKGYVRSRLIGNTYVYTPAVSESEYKMKFMSGVVSNYFEDSYKGLVSFFAQKEKISAGDLREILEMIEKGESHTVTR